MDWSLTLVADGAVLEIRASGATSFAELEAMDAEVNAHPHWHPQRALLFDLRALVPPRQLPYEALSAAARGFRSVGTGRLAILVEGDVLYGMARMYVARMAEHGQRERHVFTDRDEALAWLTAGPR
jgi:hypothetical protein